MEDQRGGSKGKLALGGGIGTIVIVIIVWLLGGDPMQFIGMQGSGTQTEASGDIPKDDTLAQFVAVVLAETEDTWTRIFQENGLDYRKPKLVLYSGQVQSACGFGSAATGPFYCPGDEKVYIDLQFFEELKTRFGAPGDFAMAYVIAHEVGHHVQKLLGTLDKVNQARQESDEVTSNRMQVRCELQADFYSGIWAYYAGKWKNILEEGDVDEAMNAAGAVGDDRLQKQSQGYVVPDSFTHGTSAQRSGWFMKGFKSGNPDSADPFQVTSDALL